MAASSNRIAWLYTDDFGTVGRVSALKHLTDQAVAGGSAASGWEAPSGVRKMRQVQVVTAAGLIRYIPAYESTATIWTTVGTAVTIQVNDAEVVAHTTGLKQLEKNRRSTHQTT
jgi:hypothetical protein